MLTPADCDRAVCALKYSQNPATRTMADFILQQYFAQLAQPILAVQAAQQIANGAKPPDTRPAQPPASE